MRASKRCAKNILSGSVRRVIFNSGRKDVCNWRTTHRLGQAIPVSRIDSTGQINKLHLRFSEIAQLPCQATDTVTLLLMPMVRSGPGEVNLRCVRVFP
ncbi:protein of unknown function (plasmid) [Cupriavidus taiwanensis]|uniref:Uncharacterized protein n=1 Tax=Cupriavidus taiwanensis TaxID=164546 RepID=A0A9Q7UY47_9BURK|nr:protein of unknown function [Cupriavidus taiwanensis]